jgi:hypothetical protein
MKKRIINVIITISLLLLFFISYYFIANKLDIGIPCPIHELTSLFCPGCGITRMLFYLLELDFYNAFRSNMLLFILLPFFLYLFIDSIISYIKNVTPLIDKISNKVWIPLIVVFIIFGILRNIEAFNFLAPINVIMMMEVL